MREFLARLLYKLQSITINKPFELYFWFFMASSSSWIARMYIRYTLNLDFWVEFIVIAYLFAVWYILILYE